MTLSYVWTWAGTAMIALSLLYTLGMCAASRRESLIGRQRPDRSEPVADDLLYVFLIPCLNEGRVIAASVERILTLPAARRRVLVINDDSDDDTEAVLSTISDSRVRVLTRRAPNARLGKGEALNNAVAVVRQWPEVLARAAGQVIIVVDDADGRLEQHALEAVAPYFARPDVGAVQIGVRINNRFVNSLARAQDIEFVTYTEIFQRGRRHLNSVGLGGNGQFMQGGHQSGAGKGKSKRRFEHTVQSRGTGE